jgi:PAS domain S-box-containing protein
MNDHYTLLLFLLIGTTVVSSGLALYAWKRRRTAPAKSSAFLSRLFDIVPMARSAVVDSMDDGVIILDLQDHIVDVNPAAEDIVGLSASELVEHPVTRLRDSRLAGFERYEDAEETHDEIVVGTGRAARYYDIKVSALYDQHDHLSGRLITIHDITERKQAAADLMAQKRLFESLVAMARATAKHTSLEATLQSAINMATTLTGAEHGNVVLVDGTGIVTHTASTRDEIAPTQGTEIVGDEIEEGLANWVIQHRQPALIHDTSQDERWTSLPDTPNEVRSALSIPIVSGSAVLGAINLHHSEPNYFNTEHAYLIQSSVDQTVLAMRNAQMYDEQRRLADHQTTLYEALRTVGQHLDPETIAHLAVETVARLTNWPGVAIFLPLDPSNGLTLQAGAGALSGAEGQYIPPGQGITGRAYRTAEVQYASNVDSDPDYIAYDRSDVPFRSELAVPIQRGERLLGMLDVTSDRLAAFNADDVLLARSLAEAIALALDNAGLYAEIRQYAADLSTLYTVARATSQSLILEDVLAETLDAALESLGFDAGLISLVDPTNERLYVAAEHGLPQVMSERLRQEGLEGTLCAYVHDQGQAFALGDIERETLAADELEPAIKLTLGELRDLGIRACSSMSLWHRERSLGAMSLFAFQPRDISSEDETLQTTIGRQIATAVTNAQLFQTIADQRSRLQALIESSRDGIILIGADQHMLVVNAPAIKLLRLSGQPDEWINRPIQNALSVLAHQAPRAVSVIQAEMERTRAGDDSPGEDECEVPPHAIHLLNLPVMAGATPLGRLLVLHDVTEERLLERMREDLIHAMVHDLRNPLTVIYGALSFLSDSLGDALSPTNRQLWTITQDNTEGMLQLVQSILEISRLEARQMPLNRTLAPLSKTVSGVLDLQRPLAADKDIRLESDVEADLPPVWVDVRLIERVLQNLVGNAIKFTPSGGVIRVEGKLQAEDLGRALVSVSDTGTGIPPEIQERLFQKFVTGEQQGRGSGLGLAFCKMVVEAHGERIWVADSAESGTTFAFTLPFPSDQTSSASTPPG